MVEKITSSRLHMYVEGNDIGKKFEIVSAVSQYAYMLTTYSLISEQVDNTDEALAKYVYKRRCQIAHFKYRQDEILNESVLVESNERLAELVKTMYVKLDNDIVKINDHFGTWSEVCFEK